MGSHGCLIRRNVNAVDLVVGDVALDPLDLRPHAVQDAARFLRDGLQLLHRQFPGSGDVPLDHELGHYALLSYGHTERVTWRHLGETERRRLEADAPARSWQRPSDQGPMSRNYCWLVGLLLAPRPASRASTMAWYRCSTPILSNTRVMWLRTVFSDNPSKAAICELSKPSAMPSSTARSRGVSSPSGRMLRVGLARAGSARKARTSATSRGHSGSAARGMWFSVSS